MPEFRRSGIEDMNRGRELADLKDKDNSPSVMIESFAASDKEVRDSIIAKERKKAPARIVVANCHVCMHPYRDFIETMLVRGQSYKGISERVSPTVDRRSISNHYKKHMDLQDAALRAILEAEAKLQGQNFEEGVQDAVTKRGVLEVMLRKGFEDIQMGVTTVEARDLVQIAKLLGEMDSHAYQVGLDELRGQVQIFIQAIKDVCDRDMQAAIASRVKTLRGREGLDITPANLIAAPEGEVVATVG